MGLLAEQITEPLVAPDDLARCDVQRVDKHPFEWPNTGGEVHATTCHYWTATNGPHRNQPSIPKQPPIVWHRAMLPPQLAGREFDAVEVSVVGTKADEILPHGWCEPNGSVGAIHPEFASRRCVIRRDGIIARRSNKQTAVSHNRFVTCIEL